MSADRSYYQRITDIIDRTTANVPASHRNGDNHGWTAQLKRIARITVIALVLFLLVAWVFDYAVARYKLARNREAFGTVQIQRYYAMKLKDGKTEITPAEPETQTCVHSLFPHFGYSPCWYVSRGTDQRIDI